MLIITTRELHFSFIIRFFPPKDVAQPTFSITYRVILPLLLAEGLMLSFFEDKCIATMINTRAKGKKKFNSKLQRELVHGCTASVLLHGNHIDVFIFFILSPFGITLFTSPRVRCI